MPHRLSCTLWQGETGDMPSRLTLTADSPERVWLAAAMVALSGFCVGTVRLGFSGRMSTVGGWGQALVRVSLRGHLTCQCTLVHPSPRCYATECTGRFLLMTIMFIMYSLLRGSAIRKVSFIFSVRFSFFTCSSQTRFTDTASILPAIIDMLPLVLDTGGTPKYVGN